MNTLTEKDDLAVPVVQEECGFQSCYNCAKCTSGCPVADQMDIKPHQAMRLLQFGKIDELLSAKSPWVCVGCQTCFARCPNKVDIPSAFSQICREVIQRGATDSAGHDPLFGKLFLGMIRRQGRVNDGLVVFRYKLRAGGLLSDWQLGLKMFKAGKMKLRVPGVIDTDSVRRLFEDVCDTAERK